MARKKKKQTPAAPIPPDIKARFRKLMMPAAMPRHTIAGFPTKNINQLWRWDTLEDVTM